MKSMSEIMAEVNARVAASRFTRAACGGAADTGIVEELSMKVKKGNQAPRRIRVLGVNALARDLGLTVGHVSQVLSGKRHSPRVMRAAKGRVIFVNREEAV